MLKDDYNISFKIGRKWGRINLKRSCSKKVKVYPEGKNFIKWSCSVIACTQEVHQKLIQAEC